MALSVGSVGDRDDNALADCVISLFRTEVINPLGPWRTVRDVDYETVRWIDCYTNRRLLAPLGHIPAAEAEKACFANPKAFDQAA